jgi:hypothetical protein
MAVAVASLISAGCVGGADPSLPADRLVGPPGRLAEVVWANEGSAVATELDPEIGIVTYVMRVDVETGERTRVRLPERSDCERVAEQVVATLPDGRVLIVQDCDPHELDRSARRTLLALDVATGDVETLGPGPGPGIPTGLAYLPHERRGWFSTGSRICGGVAPFGPDGALIDWDVTVGHADAPIELDAFFSRSGMDCPGVADEVILSGDGTRLAFIAAPDTARQGTGGGRLNAAWNIYVMDIAGPAALQPRLVYEGIEGGNGLAWSPDGGRFAIAGSIGGREGTWLIPADGGEAVRVSSSFLSRSAFSPDGTQLLGRRTPLDLMSQFVLIGLPPD